MFLVPFICRLMEIEAKYGFWIYFDGENETSGYNITLISQDVLWSGFQRKQDGTTRRNG